MSERQADQKNELFLNIKRVQAESGSIAEKLKLPELYFTLSKERLDVAKGYRPDFLLKWFSNVLHEHGSQVREQCRKILILKCLVSNWDQIFSNKYPDSIKIQYAINIKRILEFCQEEDGWGKKGEDVYWKDLALARQKLVPAGARVFDVYSGFGLRQGINRKWKQWYRFVRILTRSGGRTGFYQIHTHTPALSEFNQKGWNACFVRIAEMLNRNAEIKGIIGCSWYYDPKVPEISPRLKYLQEVPIKNGAQSFYIGKDFSGNATSKSKTREKLYSQGKYVPKTYLLIWLRKDVLRWATDMVIEGSIKKEAR